MTTCSTSSIVPFWRWGPMASALRIAGGNIVAPTPAPVAAAIVRKKSRRVVKLMLLPFVERNGSGRLTRRGGEQVTISERLSADSRTISSQASAAPAEDEPILDAQRRPPKSGMGGSPRGAEEAGAADGSAAETAGRRSTVRGRGEACRSGEAGELAMVGGTPRAAGDPRSP